MFATDTKRKREPPMPPVSEARYCKECGVEIELKIKRDLTRKWFCSKVCSARFHGRFCDMTVLWAKGRTPEVNARRSNLGERNGRWLPIGTKRQTHDMGYIEVKLSDGSWEYEHRVVANAPPDKVVHHKDENPQNNDPANLELMDGIEHLQYHAEQWRKNHVSSCQ
jgi:hypothetical protein